MLTIATEVAEFQTDEPAPVTEVEHMTPLTVENPGLFLTPLTGARGLVMLGGAAGFPTATTLRQVVETQTTPGRTRNGI